MQPEPSPKLRMAPAEPAEDLAHRFEREQRAANLQRECHLEHSLAPFRVGSVGYLNTVPLTRGIEDEVIYATPAKLAEMLQRDELDAALVSVVEVLFHDRYDILDGIAIASLGEVRSVLLAHRKPLSEVQGSVLRHGLAHERRAAAGAAGRARAQARVQAPGELRSQPRCRITRC